VSTTAILKQIKNISAEVHKEQLFVYCFLSYSNVVSPTT